MATRISAPDFVMSPAGELRDCPWWRPLAVSVVGKPPPGDQVLASFLPDLLGAFRDQDHTVLEQGDGKVQLMLGFAEVPDGPAPLRDRIPERETPLALALVREFGLPRRPENLVVLMTISERLADRPHMEIIEAARTAMARIGTPKVVFLSGDRDTGLLEEATYCTLEGGHPTDREDHAERLRDRLVTMASAVEVGREYEVVRDAFSRDAWERTRMPEAVVEAGRRMDRLGLLPAPKRIVEYGGARLSRLYERFFNLKGFSEGMLFAVDPETGTTMVTASGSWEVDKRALRREEVIPVTFEGGKLRILAPEGVRPKGPSVEAWEVMSMLASVPRVRVRKAEDGTWTRDDEGDVEVPIVRAGIHAHVGVTRVDEDVVETVPANRSVFPYGFGCGTDLMCEVAEDAAARSSAITDPEDPRAYVRWPMLYHGDTVLELWKPGVSDRPLVGLLDLYDPERVDAIDFTPDHLEQPV